MLLQSADISLALCALRRQQQPSRWRRRGRRSLSLSIHCWRDECACAAAIGRRFCGSSFCHRTLTEQKGRAKKRGRRAGIPDSDSECVVRPSASVRQYSQCAVASDNRIFAAATSSCVLRSVSGSAARCVAYVHQSVWLQVVLGRNGIGLND